MRIGLIFVVLALAALVAKWAWPRSFEITAPVGIDQAVPEVQTYVTSLVERAREKPKDPVRVADLGIALAANGFWGESKRVFEHAATLDETDPMPAFYAARASIEIADLATAKHDLERVIERFPKFAQAHYALGSVLLEEDAADAGAQRFRQIMTIEGERSIWGRVGLAKALLRQGKPDQAALLLEGVLREEPNLPPANYLLGTAYRALKRFDPANRHLAMGQRDSLVTMPDSWSNRIITESQTVKGRITHAQQLADDGRRGDATSILEATRRNHPDDLELLSNLGAFYLAADQLRSAREALTRAEALNGNHLPTLYNLAAAELKSGAPESALKYSSRALELAPGNPHSYTGQAEVLTAMNRPREAMDVVDRGIRVDPSHAGLRVMKGALLMRAGTHPDAKIELEAAVRIDPANAQAWIMLSETCLNLRRAGEARIALEQARQLTPENPLIPELARRIQALGKR